MFIAVCDKKKMWHKLFTTALAEAMLSSAGTMNCDCPVASSRHLWSGLDIWLSPKGNPVG